MTENKIYDVIIIGTGPAGLTSGIYGARYKLSVLIIGKELGGTCTSSHLIENYPGFISITGQDLSKKFIDHAKSYNIEILNKEVKGVRKENNIFIVHTLSGVYKSKTIVLSLGTQRKMLNVPGEKEFLGRGVSYCATCDCRFFKNKIVAVAGGSDAAVTSALLLAEYAKKVYIILRRDVFRAEPIWVDKLNKNPKIEKILNTHILEIKGEKVVKSLVLDRELRGNKNLAVNGIFVEIGAAPAIALVKNLGIKINKAGLIEVDRNCATNIAGCFSAGDLTDLTPLKQIITAAAQGAIAVTSVYKYISKLKTPRPRPSSAEGGQNP